MEKEPQRATVASRPSNKKLVPPGLLTQPNCQAARTLSKTGNFYVFLKDMHREFGDIVSLSPELYLFAPSEIVKEALRNAKDYRKVVGIDKFKILAGEGLFTADGDIYDQQEKVVKSAFGRKYFNEFRTIIEEEMVAFIDQRLAQTRQTNESIDLIPLSVDLTMSIAARSFFGVRGESDLAQKFRRGLVYIQDWYSCVQAVEFAEPMLRYTEEYLTRFPFLRSFQKMLLNRFSGVGEMAKAISEWKNFSLENEASAIKTAKEMRNVCAQIISLRKQDSNFEERNDVLSSLLRLQNDPGNPWLTDELIIDQVATFFVAGHETTSDLFVVLFWKHARGETPPAVVTELEGATNLVNEEKLLFQRYPNTYAYIVEMLLDHPPIPFTVRRTSRDLQVEGYSIPKDSNILLSPYVTRDVDINFGFGRRQCVGRMFALEEAVIGLHHLVRIKLKLDNSDQDLKMTQGITIGYSRDPNPIFVKCVE